MHSNLFCFIPPYTTHWMMLKIMDLFWINHETKKRLLLTPLLTMTTRQAHSSATQNDSGPLLTSVLILRCRSLFPLRFMDRLPWHWICRGILVFGPPVKSFATVVCLARLYSILWRDLLGLRVSSESSLQTIMNCVFCSGKKNNNLQFLFRESFNCFS